MAVVTQGDIAVGKLGDRPVYRIRKEIDGRLLSDIKPVFNGIDRCVEAGEAGIRPHGAFDLRCGGNCRVNGGIIRVEVFYRGEGCVYRAGVFADLALAADIKAVFDGIHRRVKGGKALLGAVFAAHLGGGVEGSLDRVIVRLTVFEAADGGVYRRNIVVNGRLLVRREGLVN